MLSKKLLDNELLGKITILSDKQFLGVVQNFVSTFANYFNFSEKELSQIELIVEEALIATITNSFSDEFIGTIDVSVSYKPGQFIISVHDQGIPVDIELLETAQNSYLSILLLKNIADEFKFVNYGKQGKSIELIKYIKSKNIIDEIARTDDGITSQEMICDDIKEIRLIRLNDVTQLSRLAFKVYGYTYMSVFYYPDKIREMIENGLLISAVCINSSDEIVGNLSLVFDNKDSKVADSGVAMVDPRYRGSNLFKRLKQFLSEYAQNKGMYGLYSEAVTIHPFTQKGNISLGAREIGVMLAYVTESITFKKISTEQADTRQSVVQYFLRTNKEPHRVIYVNPKFYDIISKIYHNLDFDREIVQILPNQVTEPFGENTHYTTSVKSDLNVADIKLEKFGTDALRIVKHQLKELCLRKIDTIYLTFPLSEPFAGLLMQQCNEIGFLFSGIIPEFADGDIIKMQYLNNVRIEREKIVLVAELANEILNVILSDYRFEE